jgi:hypothetical protein
MLGWTGDLISCLGNLCSKEWAELSLRAERKERRHSRDGVLLFHSDGYAQSPLRGKGGISKAFFLAAWGASMGA